ncbi:nudix hydrolase 20 [Mycena rebaudengoi]|nr:nudix hydrolase 20 [Mycena rebaudengoi]
MPATKSYTYLDLVNLCGNVRVGRPGPTPSEFDSEQLVPLHLTNASNSPVIGLLRPQIVDLLDLENQFNSMNNRQEVWHVVSVPGLRSRVGFHASINDHAKRTAVMKELCERWRDTGRYPDIIGPKKWRDEMYPVYRDPFGIHDYPNRSGSQEHLNFAFEMERAACALFGIITFGVHMNMYQEPVGASGEKSLRIWIPTRATTKSMWPGYLDNSVAGGIPSGMPIFEALVKECMEEASISESICRTHIRSAGCISYFFRTSKGWLQPEVEYVYDLVIPANADPAPFEPKPLDGEVERFDFMQQDEILGKMRAGQFKPNCAVVLIDLFIRLGYITPDNEPDFMRIVTNLHTQFDYERW